jgi:NADH:ubiquinone oxidoreductase subunit 6 (subunit J)
VTSSLLCLVLSLAAAAAGLWACFARSRVLAAVLFAAALAATSILYFAEDAFLPALASIVLFGGAGLLFLVPGSGRVRPAPRSAAISAAASIALLALLLAAVFAWRPEPGFGWDRDAFGSIPVLGDSMAVSWIVPLILAALMVVCVLAGASLLVKKRRE